MKRLAFVLLAIALAGCGGDANTGSNGTGVRPPPTDQMAASGPINELGPMGVAGASLDDGGTVVLVDTIPSLPATDLRLGMFADAEGLVAPSTDTGFASSASAQSFVVGPLESAVDASRGTLRVLGVTARADPNTLLEGVDRLDRIALGDWVEIFGLRLPGSEGVLATRIVVRRPMVGQSVELLTTLSDPAASPPIPQAVPIDLSRALVATASPAGFQPVPPGITTLLPGTLVRVRGTYEGGSVHATLVMTGLAPVRAEGRLTYIEGIILEERGGNRFKVGDVEVEMTAAKPLVVGARVRLRGVMRAGVLRADQVTVFAAGEKIEYIVEGAITLFASRSDLIVRGERIDASQAVISGGDASMLAQGRRVRVKGVAGPGRIDAREVTILP